MDKTGWHATQGWLGSFHVGRLPVFGLLQLFKYLCLKPLVFAIFWLRTLDKEDPKSHDCSPFLFCKKNYARISHFLQINCTPMGTKHPVSEGAHMWLHVTYLLKTQMLIFFPVSLSFFVTCPVACFPFAGCRKMLRVFFFCTPAKK